MLKKSRFLGMFALLNKGDFKSIWYVLILLDTGKVPTFCEKANTIQIMRKESGIL